jgi:hypothetical protein
VTRHLAMVGGTICVILFAGSSNRVRPTLDPREEMLCRPTGYRFGGNALAALLAQPDPCDAIARGGSTPLTETEQGFRQMGTRFARSLGMLEPETLNKRWNQQSLLVSFLGRPAGLTRAGTGSKAPPPRAGAGHHINRRHQYNILEACRNHITLALCRRIAGGTDLSEGAVA